MATNLAIDEGSSNGQQAGKHRTKKEAVTAALDEYIRRRRSCAFWTRCTVDFDPAY